jgi:hypothetical protein
VQDFVGYGIVFDDFMFLWLSVYILAPGLGVDFQLDRPQTCRPTFALVSLVDRGNIWNDGIGEEDRRRRWS